MGASCSARDGLGEGVMLADVNRIQMDKNQIHCLASVM